MSADVDPDVLAALSRHQRVRVIVTFDHPPAHAELTGFDVVFLLSSINAAALMVDRADLDRLLSHPSTLKIEADGEIRTFD